MQAPLRLTTALACAALAGCAGMYGDDSGRSAGSSAGATTTGSTKADSTTAPAPSGAAATAGAVNYSPSISRLLEASDRLRQAVQAIAQQPAGERRNLAIEQANEALYDTQSAMAALPPELRSGAGSSAQPNYTKSMERLQQAAQKLRESVQAMAQQPAGERRNKAAEEAREALLETQQAMLMLPPGLRTSSGAASGGGTRGGY